MVYNAMDLSEKEACRAKNRANMKCKYQAKKNILTRDPRIVQSFRSQINV